ncbi:predicted protein [Histoplasma mississippiense (nom. inval.)]|nr:predicted protein [Histoplasma mississippiense (nom. inval.)]EDN02286.1 predicted protein [Histoplasma mississippiense (nom. inval.)]
MPEPTGAELDVATDGDMASRVGHTDGFRWRRARSSPLPTNHAGGSARKT